MRIINDEVHALKKTYQSRDGTSCNLPLHAYTELNQPAAEGKEGRKIRNVSQRSNDFNKGKTMTSADPWQKTASPSLAASLKAADPSALLSSRDRDQRC